MKVGACLAVFVLVLASGCVTWTHAPGRDLAASTPELYSIKTPQMCLPGTCTLQGPGGEVRFSEVLTSGFGNRRDRTSFDIDYQRWKGLCRGPHSGVDGLGSRPFECTLMERGTGESATLTVGEGCATGRLVYPNGRALELRTDTAGTFGYVAPAREVSLLEGERIVVFSDRTAAFIAFHRAPKTTLPTEQVLAILAMHTYAELEGHPPECLVRARSTTASTP
jgi:hypothetical protein